MFDCTHQIWNYSKTPGRGVRELQLSIDDVLVYKGHLRKAPASEPQSKDKDFSQSILFTNDRRIVQRERHRVYVHYKVSVSVRAVIVMGALIIGRGLGPVCVARSVRTLCK